MQTQNTESKKIQNGIIKPTQENFASLYEAFWPKIFNYFFYRTNMDKSASEDLTQNVFLKALQQLPKFKDKDVPYLSYLFTIARNLLIDFYRQPKTLNIEIAAEMTTEMDLENLIEQHIQKTGLWNRIKRLMPKEQELLVLRYAKQLSIREIASVLNKSENAVKLMLSRLQRQLLEKLNLLDMQAAI